MTAPKIKQTPDANLKKLLKYLNVPEEEFDSKNVERALYRRRSQTLIYEFGRHLQSISLLDELGVVDRIVTHSDFWKNLQEMKYHFKLESRPKQPKTKIRRLGPSATITVQGNWVGIGEGDVYTVIPEPHRRRVLIVAGASPQSQF